MAVVEKIAEFIGRKVDIFGEEQEQWKVVHDKAEACFELQELLSDGIELYEKICRLDNCWHLEVYGTPDRFDQGTSDKIHSLFSPWFDITSRVLDLLMEMPADCAARALDMNLLAKLTSSHSACKAILNPSEMETEMADTALELHQTGKTEEF